MNSEAPKAFIAGFISTLIFHQGLLAVLYACGNVPRAPYSFAPTQPFLIPQVISLSLWGGIWGVVLWFVIRHKGLIAYWLWALILGAVGPSLVAWFVVFPLKGQALAGGWKPAVLIISLLLNGAWGLGTALLLRIFKL